MLTHIYTGALTGTHIHLEYIQEHLRAHTFTYIQLCTNTLTCMTCLIDIFTNAKITQCVYVVETGHIFIDVCMCRYFKRFISLRCMWVESAYRYLDLSYYTDTQWNMHPLLPNPTLPIWLWFRIKSLTLTQEDMLRIVRDRAVTVYPLHSVHVGDIRSELWGAQDIARVHWGGGGGMFSKFTV